MGLNNRQKAALRNDSLILAVMYCFHACKFSDNSSVDYYYYESQDLVTQLRKGTNFSGTHIASLARKVILDWYGSSFEKSIARVNWFALGEAISWLYKNQENWELKL